MTALVNWFLNLETAPARGDGFGIRVALVRTPATLALAGRNDLGDFPAHRLGHGRHADTVQYLTGPGSLSAESHPHELHSRTHKRPVELDCRRQTAMIYYLNGSR